MQVKHRRKTAGELSLKAASDKTRYDPLEIGHALTDDVIEQLRICGARHEHVINEPEYFVVLVVASDPLIKHLRRHKYAVLLHLPQPRPQMSVFLYTKGTQTLKRLWSLPDAKVMAVISQMQYVDKKWADTKRWCDSFYNGTFFNDIRQEHGIKHLSEKEYLDANHEELIKAGMKDIKTSLAETFDFSKVTVNKIVDSETAIIK